MLLLIGLDDQYIVKVAPSEVVNVTPLAVVNFALESCPSIHKPERHDLVLRLPILSAERSFVLVALLDSDRVIGVADVQFLEDPGSSQSVEHLRDQWERV